MKQLRSCRRIDVSVGESTCRRNDRFPWAYTVHTPWRLVIIILCKTYKLGDKTPIYEQSWNIGFKVQLHHFKVFAHPYLCRAFKIVESFRGENKHSLFPLHWSEYLPSLGSFPHNGNFPFPLLYLIEVHDAQFWVFWFQSHECSFNSENHVKFP